MTRKIPTTLASRTRPDGKRALMLRQEEREALQIQQRVERAVALFLDIEHEHSWQAIADELGISVPTLKKLTKTKEFEELYNQYFVELGHDPRLAASRQAVADLLPLAVRRLRNLLIDESTPPTVTLNAIKEVMHYTGLATPTSSKNDKNELAEFLKKAGVQEVNLTQTNTIVPPEYAAFLRDNEPEVVDGEVTEIEADGDEPRPLE
jgi:AraC-like DNA-binding protein